MHLTVNLLFVGRTRRITQYTEKRYAGCRHFRYAPVKSHSRYASLGALAPIAPCLVDFAYSHQQGEPKSPSQKTWTFSFVPQAQHHLTEGQHHFEQRENIISHSFGTNKRGCAYGANDVLRNDVALRAKGKLHFPNTKSP